MRYLLDFFNVHINNKILKIPTVIETLTMKNLITILLRIL